MATSTGEGSRSAYEIFVERVMALSAQKGSIADACRATGINRQQFNKYLSGQYLPSPANLKKIAAYLEVDSTALFAPEITAAQARQTDALGSDVQKLLAELEADLQAATLRPGIYWVFVPSVLNEGQVLITPMAISSSNGQLGMRGGRRRGAPYQTGVGERPVRLDGIVIQAGRRTNILYKETKGINGWRMLSFDAGDMPGRTFHSGILSTYLPSGVPVAYPAVMQLMETDFSRWRALYRAAGYVPYDHGRVDRRTAQALKFLQDTAQHSLFPPRLPENALQQLANF